jgi:microcystin degradation protein MlrC
MSGGAPAVPRVGLCGFFLECNRWAPVSDATAFAEGVDLAGDALAAQLRAAPSRLLPDTSGFVAAMDVSGPWEPVALRVAGAQPGGPADQAYFEGLLREIDTRIAAQGPLDAVFASMHGAALATASDDPDGEFLERLRRAVGPRVPIVAVFDLHANVSRRMTDALSGFIAYRTNPHVDLRERGAEAAALLRRLLGQGAGVGVVGLAKLPFAPSSVSQRIAPGTPYAELLERASEHTGGAVANVSLCGGFAFADCDKCGFAVTVTRTDGDRARADRLARQIATEVWAARTRFETRLVPLSDAVAAAVATGADPGAPTLILADVADNPGGGGSGATTDLLAALHRAGAQGVVLGVHADAALAADAHRAGVGGRLRARFNRSPGGDPFARPFEADATVLALSDGGFVGRRGMVAGAARDMGPSALLAIDGLRVAVITRRQQLLDPAQLEVLGIDLATVRTLVVKSRGHFRAAFEGFAPADRILEVDGAGLTSPNLKQLPWTRIPRPIHPLDDDATWTA